MREFGMSERGVAIHATLQQFTTPDDGKTLRRGCGSDPSSANARSACRQRRSMNRFAISGSLLRNIAGRVFSL